MAPEAIECAFAPTQESDLPLARGQSQYKTAANIKEIHFFKGLATCLK